MSLPTLYHYTCDHGHSQISKHVIPASWQTNAAIGLPGELAWFTDLDVPVRDALGLTSHVLHCDRTARRYRVTDTSNVRRWIEVRRDYSWGLELEGAFGARPMHWWISTCEVPVVYDPIKVAVA